jgi:MoaA/NifB/PqqE/SkfB family radical SAM enzyme
VTLKDVVARAWRDNVLFATLLELTYRCNLDCFFCYNDLSAKGRALRLDDYVRILDELAELQVLDVTLSGGEPLAHPEFFQIGAAAKERGFVVRVKSNGHALRGEVARRLRDEVDPFIVEVSLHGACAATHDRQTRVPGSFDRLLSNLAEMKSLGLRVKINSTLTLWNETEVEQMFAIADSLGMLLRFDPAVTPRDDGDEEPLNVAPTPEGVRGLFRAQFERSRALGETMPDPARSAEDIDLVEVEGKHCGAGSAAIAIDPFGNVYPCVAWRVPVGNVHEQSLRSIWDGSEALKVVRSEVVEVRNALDREGPVGSFMSFCPGLALRQTGRPDAVTQDMRDRGQILVDLMRDYASPAAPAAGDE